MSEVATWSELLRGGGLASPIEHPDRAVIALRGDFADAFWLLVDGAIEVFQNAVDGRSYLARILLPSSVLCLKECLAGEATFLQTVRVLERARLVRMSRDDALSILQAHPALCLRTLVEVSRAFCGAARLESNRMHDVESLLANVLLAYTDACGEPWDGGVRIRVKRTQAELAECVGVNERTVHRVLGAWKDAGIVDKRDARYLVLDRERLGAFVEEGADVLVHRGRA